MAKKEIVRKEEKAEQDAIEKRSRGEAKAQVCSMNHRAKNPQIISLGKLSVDTEQISESEGTMLRGILIRAYQGDQHTYSELIKLVLDIIHRQNPQVPEEELLQTVFDEEHIAASVELIGTIVKYTVLHYCNLHHWVEAYITKHEHEEKFEQEIRELRELEL